MGCGIRCIISHKNLALNAMNNMAKSANINIRIDPEIKLSAEKIFSSFGITITDAINIFLHKSNPTIKSSSNTHESPWLPPGLLPWQGLPWRPRSPHLLRRTHLLCWSFCFLPLPQYTFDGFSVNQDNTCSACASAASVFCRCNLQIVPEKGQKGLVCL